MRQDNQKDNDVNTASSSDASVSQELKRLPKGIILGKDGKPCRSCNSFTAFTSQSKKATKNAPLKPTSNLECPPDIEELGRSSWTLLHAISASYPERPTQAEQSQVKQFLGLFSKIYPCWVCAEDFQDYMAKNKIRTESRDSFGRWMCEAHNDVNRKLGKTEFDCNQWHERWRIGWADGSCD